MKYGNITDPVQLSIGQGLVNFFDGDFLKSIKSLREQIFSEYGVRLNSIHIIDAPDLPVYNYQIQINGQTALKFTLQIGKVLLVDYDSSKKKLLFENQINFTETTEPLFNQPAFWINSESIIPEMNEITPQRLICVHLKQVICNNLSKIITTQTVSEMLADLRKSDSVLVMEIKKHYEISYIRNMLQHLLAENVPITNFRLILKKMSDLHLLQEDCFFYIKARIRSELGLQICNLYMENNELHILTLSASLTNLFLKGTINSDQARKMVDLIAKEYMSNISKLGSNQLVIAVDARVFENFFDFLKNIKLDIPVLTEDEILSAKVNSDFSVKCESIISLEKNNDLKTEMKLLAINIKNQEKRNLLKRYIEGYNSKAISEYDYSKLFYPEENELEERVSICDVIVTNNHCAVGINLEFINGNYHREFFLRNCIPQIKAIAMAKGIKVIESEYAVEIFRDNHFSDGIKDFIKKVIHDVKEK